MDISRLHQEEAGTYQNCLYICVGVIYRLRRGETYVWSVLRHKNGQRQSGEPGALLCTLKLVSRWAAVRELQEFVLLQQKKN